MQDVSIYIYIFRTLSSMHSYSVSILESREESLFRILFFFSARIDWPESSGDDPCNVPLSLSRRSR